MVKGFRDFILRGNLVELAVAFVIGAAFATVVSSFVSNLMMPLIGKIVDRPDFGSIAPGGIPVGAFINDLVAFLITAAAVYFIFVVPYTKIGDRYQKPDGATADAASEEVKLLREIRDLLSSH